MQESVSEYSESFSRHQKSDVTNTTSSYIVESSSNKMIESNSSFTNEYQTQGPSTSIGHYTQMDFPVHKIVYENEPVPVPVDARYGSQPDYITSKVRHLREVFKEKPDEQIPIQKTGKIWTPVDSRWEPVKEDSRRNQVGIVGLGCTKESSCVNFNPSSPACFFKILSHLHLRSNAI